MKADSITTGTRRLSARRKTARQFIPPQHGAWAMLLVPWLTGVLVAGFHWAHLPLFGAWLAGYLLSYYALQAIKTRRLSRFRPQLLLYGRSPPYSACSSSPSDHNCWPTPPPRLCC